MRSASRRDPKKFTQRTLAAAVAASALAGSGIPAWAQTTGGGIGAAVDGNAPATTVLPGSGPGINNTRSPVIGLPENLNQPIGGNTGPRGPNGISRLPGSTPPASKTAPGAGRNQPGSSAPPGQIAPPVNPARTNRGTSAIPGSTGTPAGGSVTRRPANTSSNLRSGQITNVNGNSFTFQEGAVTTTLNLTPRAVIQMNGKPIALSDIPSNARVQIERSPTNANQVQRVVVTPQVTSPAAADTAIANPLPNRTDIPDRPRDGSVDTNANSQVTLPANPNPQEPPSRRPPVSRWQDSMNERLGMGLNASKDVVVVGDVTRDSLAGRSGFLKGDRIESLNGRAISTPADLTQALEASGQQGRFTARVVREGVPQDVNLSLPQGFFNTAGITGAAAGNVGVGAAVGLGGGLAVTPDGNVGVGVPVAPGVGVVVPAEGGGAVGTTGEQGGGGATARGAASPNSAQRTAAARGGATPRDSAPIGTSRSPGSLTTEALKIPDVDLGWNLKPTSEGVQGATQANPTPLSPTEQSLKTLEQENRELKAEIERLKNQQP